MSLAEEVAAQPDAETMELRRTAERLQRQLATAKAKTADLIEAVYQGARDAQTILGPPPKLVTPKRDRRTKNVEVALVHATDWQCGKVTETFNRDKLDLRVGMLAEKVRLLTGLQRSEHVVDECVLMLGGDMVEGVTVFPNQAWEVDASLNDQIFHVARTMETLARDLAAVFPVVRVFCVVGNHGRLGRIGDFPEQDNADAVAYRICAERNTEKRIEWNVATSWFHVIDIGAYRPLLIHGHEIKMFGGNLPSYGIVRRISAWGSGVLPQFSAAYVGHFHTYQTFSTVDGRAIYIGNTPESDNGYASRWIGAMGAPSQRLQFVDPVHGRVNSDHQVFL